MGAAPAAASQLDDHVSQLDWIADRHKVLVRLLVTVKLWFQDETVNSAGPKCGPSQATRDEIDVNLAVSHPHHSWFPKGQFEGCGLTISKHWNKSKVLALVGRPCMVTPPEFRQVVHPTYDAVFVKNKRIRCRCCQIWGSQQSILEITLYRLAVSWLT